MASCCELKTNDRSLLLRRLIDITQGSGDSALGQEIVASTMTEQVGDYTIVEGAIQVHIAIPSGAMADVDGVTLTGPISLNLPSLAYGAHDRRYPAVEITAVTGTIIVREDR